LIGNTTLVTLKIQLVVAPKKQQIGRSVSWYKI